MADVSGRDLAVADVLRHRVVEIYVSDGTDKLWRIQNVRFKLAITAFENIPAEDTETLVDGSELTEITATNHRIEFTWDEVNEDDIDTINGSSITDIGWVTETGGANGTGRDCILADCDAIVAYIQDGKTVCWGKKRSSGKDHGFTFTDNSA